MENTKDNIKKLYRHHLVRYVIAGGCSFVLDFGLLFFFRLGLHLNLALATSIGYWTSVVFNFFVMRHWTFSAGDKKNLRKHALTYGILLAFNYTFTVLFVSIVSHSLHSFGEAKSIAVAKILA